MILARTFLTTALLFSPLACSQPLEISNAELQATAERIDRNETGGQRARLVHWNDGEQFASLGIGHFIWYPAGMQGPFVESFPGLILFYQQHGVTLPPLFAQHQHSPWHTLAEFNAAYSSEAVQQAIDFLAETKSLQVAYIMQRVEAALPQMQAASQHPTHVAEQFYRLANSAGGLYPLIDYLNFKGEGTAATERYQGQGWGLLQALERMNAETSGPEALQQFSQITSELMRERVANAPIERGEQRWLAGWLLRTQSYRPQ